MPALPDVAKVLKVAVIWSDGINTDIVTRFYLQYTGAAPSAAELNTFCIAVKDQVVTNFNFAINAAYTLGRVHAIDLSSPSGAEGNWSGGVPGTGTLTPLGADMAVVISYEISRRYRGGHPRGYWPFGQSGDLEDPQRWSTDLTTAVQTNVLLFFPALAAAVWSGGGTLQQVNVSYFLGFTVVTNPTTHRARNVPTVRATPVVDAVTSYVTRTHVGTQRRRLQY